MAIYPAITRENEIPLAEPSETKKIILDIPANIKYLETVSACVKAVLQREPEQNVANSHFAITLAVHEVCTNIIEHAYCGQSGRIRVEIAIYHNPAKIVVEIFDEGKAAELEKISHPNLDDPQVKGYGLYLVKQLVDEMMYFRDNNVNRWQLVKML